MPLVVLIAITHIVLIAITHIVLIAITHIVLIAITHIVTSLAKEVMFLVALVSLSVCLSVDKITQARSQTFLTPLTPPGYGPDLLKKLRTDWDEILWRGLE